MRQTTNTHMDIKMTDQEKQIADLKEALAKALAEAKAHEERAVDLERQLDRALR